MKKTILILFLFLCSFVSYSQNAIKYSFSDVKTLLDNDGVVTSYGYTKGDDPTKYLMGYDTKSIRVYYFLDNNICFAYSWLYRGLDRDGYVKALEDEGYKRLGSDYYTDQYQLD